MTARNLTCFFDNQSPIDRVFAGYAFGALTFFAGDTYAIAVDWLNRFRTQRRMSLEDKKHVTDELSAIRYGLSRIDTMPIRLFRAWLWPLHTIELFVARLILKIHRKRD